MTRRRFVAVTCALLAFAPASLPSVTAQDKGKDGQNGKKEKDPKDSAEWKACAAIGALFQAKDSAGLVARMRQKGKLKLALGATNGDFEKKQAVTNLDTWFKGKTELEVEMKSIRDLTGTLPCTYKAKGKDKKTSLSLLITLEKKDTGEGFFLTKIETV